MKRMIEPNKVAFLNKVNNFEKAITSPSIVEDMEGYSFSKNTIENATMNVIYAGVVKNGNKLTFALLIEFTRTGTLSFGDIGTFSIPSSVASKLYPAPLTPLNDSLGAKVVNFYASYNTKVAIDSVAIKGTNSIYFRIYGLSSLTQDTKYQARIEVTFLLSDNLAN